MKTDNGTKALIAALWNKYRRVITFCAVGAVNTGVDFLVFTLTVTLFAAPAEIGQAAGYTAGLINSFIFNKTLTFKQGATGRAWSQILRFAAVNAVTLGVSVGLISLLTRSAGLNEFLAKIVVTVLVMGINYFGYKLLVFRVKE